MAIIPIFVAHRLFSCPELGLPDRVEIVLVPLVLRCSSGRGRQKVIAELKQERKLGRRCGVVLARIQTMLWSRIIEGSNGG